MSESARSTETGEAWQCSRCEAWNPSSSSSFPERCPGCGAARDTSGWIDPGGPSSSGDPRPGPWVIPNVWGRGPRFRSWIGAANGVATWTWALAVLMALLLIRWVGDRWWGVAFVLFFPRWLFLAPLPALAIAGGLGGRPRQWIVQGVVALVVAGPLMRLSLPISQLQARPIAGLRVRVMTFNRGEHTIDVRRLTRLIERERIDLICFQEGVGRPTPKLDAYFAANGWHRDRAGLLASRYPIVSEWPWLAGDVRSKRRLPVILIRAIRAAPGVEFGLATVHMPTLRFGFYRFFDHDLEGLEQHLDWWDSELGRVVDGLSAMSDVPTLVGGDFNAPPDHATMAALSSSYRFAFEDAGWGYGYTPPTRSPWFRIDHLLASPEWVFTRCWVGPDLGSDHLPLIAEAVLPTAESLEDEGAGETPGCAE